MRPSSRTAALVTTALIATSAALAANGPAASAASAASSSSGASTARAASAPAGDSGRDLVIVPPATLNLTAPPYVSDVVTVSYGARVTLDLARDDVPPGELSQPLPGKVPPPSGGRYVAFRLTVVNTGSAGSGIAIFRPDTSIGQVYGYTGLTLRGCPYYYDSSPWPLAPGATHSGCVVYEVNTGVKVTGGLANIGFTMPSARGAWRTVDREPARRSYVALGDSYSSGEGSGDYDKTDPSCHRGARAWPRLLARALPALLKMPSDGLIACSGAVSAELDGWELGQLDRTRTRPSVITVTIGGNDVGFVPTLQACVLQPTCGRAIDKARAAIADEAAALDHDYATIRRFEPQAAVVVVGYPRLFPRSQRDVVLSHCPWLIGQKQGDLNDLDARLDAAIAKAAAKERLPYVNVTDALQGHEACTADSWIYPIGRPDPSKGWLQQDGHPTTPGQAAIAAKVESYLTGRYYR